MKVLVIRFSSIGDIVLTTPVVRCLKQQIKNVELHFLTKSSFGSIVHHNPYIDKVHQLDNSIDDIIDQLKKEKFDCIIDLHHNLRSLRIKKALKTQSFSFPKLNIQKWLYVNLKVNILPDESIVERYFKTVKTLDVKNDGRGLDYFLDEKLKLKSEDIPMSHWGGYVGCVIGGSYSTKKFPVEQWKKLCALIPYPIILLGGAEDREAGNEIREIDPIRIYNSCGKFHINESAELVKIARIIISNDTGLMHIAAAFKKPLISLWGNTTPELGMFPYYGFNNLKERVEPTSIIFENKNLSCRPCSKLGYNNCPKKHFDCMNGLDMNQISNKVKGLWTQSK